MILENILGAFFQNPCVILEVAATEKLGLRRLVLLQLFGRWPSEITTLKTNSAPLKIDGWKLIHFLLTYINGPFLGETIRSFFLECMSAFFSAVKFQDPDS